MEKLILSLNLFIFFQHSFFCLLEAFLWKSPFGRKIFRLTHLQAEQTYHLAINQGFYNLFFAFGFLLCALPELNLAFRPDPHTLHIFNLYLAMSIIGAAIVGGITVSARILLIQGIPSTMLALALLAQLYF